MCMPCTVRCWAGAAFVAAHSILRLSFVCVCTGNLGNLGNLGKLSAFAMRAEPTPSKQPNRSFQQLPETPPAPEYVAPIPAEGPLAKQEVASKRERLITEKFKHVEVRMAKPSLYTIQPAYPCRRAGTTLGVCEVPVVVAGGCVSIDQVHKKVVMEQAEREIKEQVGIHLHTNI